MLPTIVLASRSPARIQILKQLRLKFDVDPSTFEEPVRRYRGEPFDAFARRLALGKARNVASRHQNAIIVGADSFAVLNGRILGKPLSRRRAVAYLCRLSGRVHDFYTGMALIDTTRGTEVVACAKARVRLADVSRDDARRYVERENVGAVASASKIEGVGSILARRINGDYYAIVGLSPATLAGMFKRINRNLLDYVEPE